MPMRTCRPAIWRSLCAAWAVALLAGAARATEQYPLVLVYHQVVPAGSRIPKGSPVMALDTLESQFRYLAENGIRTLSIEEYIEAISQPVPLRHAVLLTFDDGYESMFTLVYPLLEQYDLHAVSFVITSRVGRKNEVNPNQPWLDWDECRLLEESGRVDIEAHGHDSHRKVVGQGESGRRSGPYLTTRTYLPATGALESLDEYRERIYSDLLLSRTTIEELLGKRVKAFAWPLGKTNQDAIDAAGRAGYLVTFGLQQVVGPDTNRVRWYSPQSWGFVVERISEAPPDPTPLPTPTPRPTPTPTPSPGVSAGGDLSPAQSVQPHPPKSRWPAIGMSIPLIAAAALAGAVTWALLYYLVFSGKIRP